MKILLSGSHGLVGTALKEALDSEGHTVIRLGRDFNKPIQFNDVDAVIHGRRKYCRGALE